MALANARAPRRPTKARAAVPHDALRDEAAAAELLSPFLDQPVSAADLLSLRELHQHLVTIVDALIEGSPPPLHALNALAATAPAVHALAQAPGGGLKATLRPARPSAAAKVLLATIDELGRLDPVRLRRCDRPECRLVFYDSTRSATQRWHAERPCGLRERQRRHRARQAGD